MGCIGTERVRGGHRCPIGRSDNDSNWVGRIDEVAVFDRALNVVKMTGLLAKWRPSLITPSPKLH